MARKTSKNTITAKRQPKNSPKSRLGRAMKGGSRVGSLADKKAKGSFVQQVKLAIAEISGAIEKQLGTLDKSLAKCKAQSTQFTSKEKDIQKKITELRQKYGQAKAATLKKQLNKLTADGKQIAKELQASVQQQEAIKAEIAVMKDELTFGKELAKLVAQAEKGRKSVTKKAGKKVSKKSTQSENIIAPNAQREQKGFEEGSISMLDDLEDQQLNEAEIIDGYNELDDDDESDTADILSDVDFENDVEDEPDSF